MKYAIQAIDCVVNPITPDIMRLRPDWSKDFWRTFERTRAEVEAPGLREAPKKKLLRDNALRVYKLS